jgi:hypothetical protein
MFPMIGRLATRVGGSLLAGNTAHNLYQQHQVLSGNADAPEGSRLQAVSASSQFPEGTVGYGAHLPIRTIHGVFGSLGEAQIGSLFSSPHAQNLMSQPINSPANLELGRTEHGYWDNVYQNPPQRWDDPIGGYMGSSFSPETRAFIQSTSASLRSYANILNGRGGGSE